MKTIIMFKNSIANLICLLLIIVPFVNGYSQTCTGNQVAITIENAKVVSSKALEFDVYITNTGETSLSLASVQGGVIFDRQMIAGGATVTFSSMAGSTDFPQFNNITTKYSADTNQLRWFQNPVSLSSGKTVGLPSNKKLKFASFRLTSSHTLNNNLIGKIVPQMTTKFGYTNLLATVYCNGNTNSFGLKPTNTKELLNNNGSDFNVAAYPNPFAEGFHLDIKSISENDIQIKAYDMLGKLIDSQNIEVPEIENHTIGSNYPAGVYNLNVTQGIISQNIRIIKK